MNNIRLTLWSFVLVFVVFGCENSNEITTPSGFAFNYVEKGAGEEVEDGNYLILDMSYKDNNDSIWFNTDDRGIGVAILKQDSIWKIQGGQIEEVFSYLKKDDSVEFSMSIKDFYEKAQKLDVPASVDSTGTLKFSIGVSEVLDQEGIFKWRQEAIAKQEKMQLDKDTQAIDDYLTENNIQAETTASGLRYVITESGAGDNAQAGDTVGVSYTGHLLNGPIFDSSYKEIAEKEGLYNPARTYEPYKFKLGQGAVIKGWDEGITLLNKGGKATLYVPSTLAYGPQAASRVIGPNSILVFDVELAELIKSDEKAN